MQAAVHDGVVEAVAKLLGLKLEEKAQTVDQMAAALEAFTRLNGGEVK